MHEVWHEASLSSSSPPLLHDASEEPEPARGMVVKIRLARFGKANAPFYNIVVANARTARNSKPIEVLGTYDPIPKPPPFGQGKPFKDIKLDIIRAKYWLGVGAQPSDPAWRLLAMVGLLEPKYSIIQAQQQKAPATGAEAPQSRKPSAVKEAR